MPPRFSVLLTASFRRDLERLSPEAQKKVLDAVASLEENPFGPPARIKKLRGRKVGQWRMKVWPHRVRYDVIGNEVILYRVRHRKDIYRD